MMLPSALPGALGALAPMLNSYGYLAVGGLLFVEDFGVPVPGEALLVAAAVYAGAGRLNIVLVVLIGVLAAVAGDNVGYALGRFGGRRLVRRFGHYAGLTSARLDAAERFFTRHGGKVVIVARFVEGLRQANGIVAGTTGMPWRRFLLANIVGAVLWVGVWASTGYLIGTHIGSLYAQIHRYQLSVLLAVAVLITGLITWRLLHRRHRRDADPADT